jgi:hypothetical protein
VNSERAQPDEEARLVQPEHDSATRADDKQRDTGRKDNKCGGDEPGRDEHAHEQERWPLADVLDGVGVVADESVAGR